MAIHKPLTFRVRAELYAQLAQMEMAGLPFDRALNVLQVAEPAQSRLQAMRALIGHHDFALAGERSGLFTKLEARLIHASINAGSPAHMYRQLADFYGTRARQVATMKSRMLMPAAVFMLALAIQPLPGLVTGSMGVSAYLYQVLRPMVVVALMVFGVRWWLSRPAAAASQNAASPWMSIPLLGKLIVRQNVRDFLASLGLMLEAGIPMLDALPLALDTIAEPSIKREFSRIAPRMAGGATLAQAIADSAFLGRALDRERAVALINSGEQSGTLPEMLLRHTTMESIAINASFEQLATWVPRVVYGLVMLWMVSSLLSGPGLMPRAIADL
jgi:type II secretory pathway component PulF